MDCKPCKQWKETWVAYLYEECSAEEHAAIEAHLAECKSCSTRMGGLDATRRVLQSTTPEIAAPPRVIVLPAAPRRAAGMWGFAGGFAAAAALFVVGMFAGMNLFSTQTTVLETARGEDLDGPVATTQGIDSGRAEVESGIQQVRNDYRGLDDRLGRVESWLPESQGDTLPRLATEDRLQVAVGNLVQEIDLRRNQDLRLFLQAVYTAEQTARRRDVTLSQAIEIISAESDPNVRRH